MPSASPHSASRTSSAALVARLKRIVREFSELQNEDTGLPLAQRSAMSMLVAIRHWELEAFVELRRRKGPQTRVHKARR